MVGSFDYYSDACFGTLESQFGLGITFISAGGSYPNTPAYGMVDNRIVSTDDYGNRVIEENKKITVASNQIPILIAIGDSITVNDENKTYVILDMEPDVNTSKVFYLSE